MIGLLGTDWQDPRTQAALQLAAGLLGGRTLGQGLSKGLADYSASLRQGSDRAMKERELEASIESERSQTELRKIKAEREANLLDAVRRWTDPSHQQFGAGTTAMQAVAAAGGPVGPSRQAAELVPPIAQQQRQANPLYGVPSEAIEADLTFNNGKKVGEWLYKRGSPDMVSVNGVMVDRNRTPHGYSVPNVSQDGKASQVVIDPNAPGGFRVVVPPGAMDAYTGYRDADESAKARYDLIKTWDPQQQREVYTTRAGIAGGSPSPQSAPRLPAPSQTADPERYVSPQVQAQRDAQRRNILAAELGKAELEGRREDAASIRAEMQRMRGGRQTQQPQPHAAGPSVYEKNAATAGDKINDSWIKTSLEPTLAAGESATGMLSQVHSARMALQGVGTTGWGAEARVSAANVLSSLGVPQAQQIAANAAAFQQVASTRLWEVLGAQKGPQTEGDADRARQTFASIKNPVIANQFILDMAAATAERDRMKAAFYRDALPLAQREGDLARVDREWQKVAPSIWSLPLMKRWLEGVR